MRKGDPNANLLTELGYETRDVSLVTLIKWGTALFGFMGLSAAFALVMYVLFIPREQTPANNPESTVRQLPPSPVLQANPVVDIRDYRQWEDRALTGYGKATTGGNAIPIQRAIDRIAEQGLPDPTDTSKSVQFTPKSAPIMPRPNWMDGTSEK